MKAGPPRRSRPRKRPPHGPAIEIPGALVALPLPGRRERLDGFWRRRTPRNRTLLVFVHGMGGNFYRSRLKQELLLQAPAAGFDVLTFNNRGCEERVAGERFADCLGDLDAALRFGAAKGYRRFVLLGHSTGCQKSTYFQARRRDPRVRALVLAAPGDDYAISRRELQRRHGFWVARARRLVAAGRGAERLPPACKGFTARRFLSAADPRQAEAALFDYAGPMRLYRRIAGPVLAFFGTREEYACLPVQAMGRILREKSRSRRFAFAVVRGANHGFRGHERATVRLVLRWLQRAAR